jgi:sarcosine oxidase subunit delta
LKILTCPLNGPRNIQEFVYGGEVKPLPDETTATAEEWSDYVFLENNLAGVVREWWMHVPTGYWFIAERDTEKDAVLRTYPADRMPGGADEPPDPEAAP